MEVVKPPFLYDTRKKWKMIFFVKHRRCRSKYYIVPLVVWFISQH
jgi:hypothetical protein